MRLSLEDLGQDSVNNENFFLSNFINELKSNKSYIRQMMRLEEFFMTSVLSRLMIEELNHMVSTPRGSSFYSVGLSLHTARHH